MSLEQVEKFLYAFGPQEVSNVVPTPCFCASHVTHKLSANFRILYLWEFA